MGIANDLRLVTCSQAVSAEDPSAKPSGHVLNPAFPYTKYQLIPTKTTCQGLDITAQMS